MMGPEEGGKRVESKGMVKRKKYIDGKKTEK
jgi:hypothetical protein